MTKNLTPKQTSVLNLLKSSRKPMSAYTILDALHNDGFRAPLQVYRALDTLINLGYVHRLETLNSFVSCAHQHHNSQDRLTVFTICDRCQQADEVDDVGVGVALDAVTKTNKFHSHHSTIEIHGVCRRCVDR